MRSSEILKRSSLALTALLWLGGGLCFPALAEPLVPDHKSYTHTYSGEPAEGPAPCLMEQVITGENLGCGNFVSPTDVFRSTDGRLYIADTGNNRIVVLSPEGAFLQEYRGATPADGGATHAFNGPQGVFVTEQGDLYVADTENGLVVHMDAQGNLIRTLVRPEGAVINESMVFKPSKVVVDPAGRIHVVSLFVNQGIIEYSPEGEFDGFLAAGKVNPSPIEVFWKKVSTDAQRNRMMDFVPIEYNNLALDGEGFIFATMAAMNKDIILSEIGAKKGTEEGTLVRKLNMLGNDILRREGFFPSVGEVDITDYQVSLFAAYKGPSNIVDVSCGPYGTFSLLDNNRRHIFAYDVDGNLLYAFGGANTAVGGFTTPLSMAQSEDHYYVLDKQTGALTVFGLTAYGRAIHQAIALYETGRYDESATAWQEVLRQNANMDLAYSGIGKSLYRQGQYKEAMEYFRSSSNKPWYSQAFQEYRKTVIATWFPRLALALVAVFGALFIRNRILALRRFLKGGVAP